MIFPIVLLIVAGMISGALKMYEGVKSESQLHRNAILSEANIAGTDICLIMRGQWVIQ